MFLPILFLARDCVQLVLILFHIFGFDIRVPNSLVKSSGPGNFSLESFKLWNPFLNSYMAIQTFHVGWTVVVYVCWGNGPFLLSSPVYTCVKFFVVFSLDVCRLCSYVPCFIPDIGNLNTLFFFLILARYLTALFFNYIIYIFLISMFYALYYFLLFAYCELIWLCYW